MVRYVSTRGGVPPCDFEQALLAGLAADGGLYLPERWPRFDPDEIDALRGASYQDVALRILAPFTENSLSETELRGLIQTAYGRFDHQAIAPLRQLDADEWLLELFHGPTLAFKDIALQLLGHLFEHFLDKRGRSVTIVGATSGDTGAAAIEACAGRERMAVVILHPHGRISEVQRRQMTTVTAGNVHNIAIEGTFDDCQALLKGMFDDQAFRERLRLAAVNSINWARVVAQTVYYVTAAVALGAPWRKIAFAVPTGNFGDIYAGYVAARIGLPIAQLTVATNRNDILARFFRSGRYSAGEVHPTMSPSMDIQVASNFERLLFDLCAQDGRRVRDLMAEFVEQRGFSVPSDAVRRARELFDAASVEEPQTGAAMAQVFKATGELVDPHTAVGIHAGRSCRLDPATPLVFLSTAHPAKFPEAVERATGVRPALPARLADLLDRKERFEVLSNDLATVQAHIQQCVMAEV